MRREGACGEHCQDLECDQRAEEQADLVGPAPRRGEDQSQDHAGERTPGVQGTDQHDADHHRRGHHLADRGAEAQTGFHLAPGGFLVRRPVAQHEGEHRKAKQRQHRIDQDQPVLAGENDRPDRQEQDPGDPHRGAQDRHDGVAFGLGQGGDMKAHHREDLPEKRAGDRNEHEVDKEKDDGRIDHPDGNPAKDERTHGQQRHAPPRGALVGQDADPDRDGDRDEERGHQKCGIDGIGQPVAADADQRLEGPDAADEGPEEEREQEQHPERRVGPDGPEGRGHACTGSGGCGTGPPGISRGAG